MDLNCKGPFIRGFFSVVNLAVLHDPWLVESVDMEEPLVWRDNCNLYEFSTVQSQHP